MYRFLARPKWIVFTLVVVGAAVLMVNLGFWQLQRLDERQTFNRLVTDRTAAATVPFEQLSGLPTDEREWRSVSLTGAFDGPTDRVPTAGGYLLVAPFTTTDGITVYVNRGSVSSSEDVPEPPAGTVRMTARFRTAPSSATSVPGTAEFLERVGSIPDDVGVTAAALPALDDGPHLSYAFQWFIFSVCVLVGWVLAVRRSARSARSGSRDERGPDDGPGPLATRPKRSKHEAVPWQDDIATPTSPLP